MANNRLYLVAVDDARNVTDVMTIAKHMGGSWYVPYFYTQNEESFTERLDNFFENAFINGCGITLMTEDMQSPLPDLGLYNDDIERGVWVFIPCDDAPTINDYWRKNFSE